MRKFAGPASSHLRHLLDQTGARKFVLVVAAGRDSPHIASTRRDARPVIEGTTPMENAPREGFWLRNTDWFLPGGILIVGLAVLFVMPLLKRIL